MNQKTRVALNNIRDELTTILVHNARTDWRYLFRNMLDAVEDVLEEAGDVDK